ncbi:MAG: hypothetical protein ACRDA5_11780, partial [Clostridium sp.]
EMILRPMGGPKNMVLNGYSSKAEWDRIGATKPSLLPAAVSSSTTDSRDGNYTLTVSVPANSKGTSFDLYEGNTIIKSQAVTNVAQKYTYDITKKPNGTYNYKVVMKDATKQIESSIVSVYVGPEVVLKAPVVSASSSISETGNYTVKVNVPAASNGTSMDVYEGTTKIATEVIDSNAKEFTYDVKAKANGTYNYKAIIKSSSKTVESNVLAVKVAIKVVYEAYNATKPYTMNDVVEYQGKIYKSKGWWVVGITPGTNSGVWEYIGDVPKPEVIDLAMVADKYNSKKGDALFDAKCDLNSDNIIDLFDIVLVAKTTK